MNYLNERDFCDSGIPPVALLIPILLAQVFGVTDPALIEKVTIANLNLDHFSHLVDDTADSPSSNSPIRSHLSHLLLSRATASLLSLSSHPATFSQWFDRYLLEATMGEQALWSHHKVANEYTQQDYDSLAHRGGLIKASAAIYADLTDRWQILDSVERGLCAASIGIQLIDDVMDWQDDLHQGIYTQPLVAAFQIVGVETALRNPSTVNQAIVRDGAADAVIRLAAKYFDDASRYFERVKADSLKMTTVEFSNELRDLLLILAKTRKDTAVIPDFRTMLQKKLVIRMQH